ncbi:MAG: hypothetical protein KBT53_07695 [Porticoccus sp.]|nr:hypothetical protein [Porticoccus sp.]MBQ0808409.1 hypothetical protein [Porticoccus sp.]
MKFPKLFIVFTVCFLTTLNVLAHDEEKEYIAIAKAVEEELQAVVTSDNASEEVREFSAKLLKEQYGSERVGRFWVKEISK